MPAAMAIDDEEQAPDSEEPTRVAPAKDFLDMDAAAEAKPTPFVPPSEDPPAQQQSASAEPTFDDVVRPAPDHSVANITESDLSELSGSDASRAPKDPSERNSDSDVTPRPLALPRAATLRRAPPYVWFGAGIGTTMIGVLAVWMLRGAPQQPPSIAAERPAVTSDQAMAADAPQQPAPEAEAPEAEAPEAEAPEAEAPEAQVKVPAQTSNPAAEAKSKAKAAAAAKAEEAKAKTEEAEQPEEETAKAETAAKKTVAPATKKNVATPTTKKKRVYKRKRKKKASSGFIPKGL
jgi:hypothetical protein